MKREAERVESARSANLRRGHRAARRTLEWSHYGVLELAWGWQSEQARHLVLRSYAIRFRAEMVAQRVRLTLLDGGGRTLERVAFLLPLSKVDLAELVFYERASFAECDAWPSSSLPVLAEKNAEARLHVLRADGEAPSDFGSTRPKEADDAALSAAARFLDLERAELVLLLRGAQYEIGAAWLERPR